MDNLTHQRIKPSYIFLGASLVIICIFSAIVQADSESKEFGVGYESLGYQYDFIDQLVASNIPFYIDNEGIIKFSNQYAEVVKKIMVELDSRPSTKIADRKYASAIALLFNKNAIAYIVREDRTTGEFTFIWSKEDDVQARQLVEVDFINVIQESYKTGRLGEHNISK